MSSFDSGPVFDGDITGPSLPADSGRARSSAAVVGGVAGRGAARAAKATTRGAGALVAWGMKSTLAALAEAFKPGTYKARPSRGRRASKGTGYYALKQERDRLLNHRQASARTLLITHTGVGLACLFLGLILGGR